MDQKINKNSNINTNDTDNNMEEEMKHLKKKEMAAVDPVGDEISTSPENDVNNQTNDNESFTKTQELKKERDMSDLETKIDVVADQDGTGEPTTELQPEPETSISAQLGNTPESGALVTGAMDYATLQGMYGENFGVSGYKMAAAKSKLIMPQNLPLIEWSNNFNNPAFSVADLLNQGKDLLQKDVADYNALMHVFGYQGAEWHIHIGKVLLKLKALVRKSGQMWGVWAVNNFKSVGERTMEKMMRLARREDSWRYSILGSERLDVLCTAIPQSNDGSNAIGAFLERHEIRFDPTLEFDLQEFKHQVDYALNVEKLQKKGLTISPEKVAALVDNGYQIDGAAIKEFQTIQRSGGILENHVDFLIMSGGKENSDKTPEQRLQDVNTLASRLTKSLDLIISKQDLIEMIDRDIYRRLLEKLNDISMLRDMDTDYKAVA